MIQQKRMNSLPSRIESSPHSPRCLSFVLKTPKNSLSSLVTWRHMIMVWRWLACSYLPPALKSWRLKLRPNKFFWIEYFEGLSILTLLSICVSKCDFTWRYGYEGRDYTCRFSAYFDFREMRNQILNFPRKMRNCEIWNITWYYMPK